MPTYEFMDDDGQLHEEFMAMSEAPRIGESCTLADGTPVTRIASLPESQRNNWQPYISSRLPRGIEGVNHTPQGKPIIESRSQEREVAARMGMVRE